ncbi:hypothetical protein D9611_011605 [Ephemerocybe angulata]|uniref:Uncharacterized protein n=1 Tax=Ephemerocybe angulata TaxID=980116 RepID=A0A8H5ETJ2_9AGAR|nr:hypothetical protein D9611_011605 [Tulosesus angulatus]
MTGGHTDMAEYLMLAAVELEAHLSSSAFWLGPVVVVVVPPRRAGSIVVVRDDEATRSESAGGWEVEYTGNREWGVDEVELRLVVVVEISLLSVSVDISLLKDVSTFAGV